MPAKPEAYVEIEAAASPAFSRDGGTLYYLRGSSLPQIWALDLATGQNRALTDHDEKIAFIRRAPTPETARCAERVTRWTPCGLPECSGQRSPTGAGVMQSVQIGRPHSEQERPVSRSGCR